MQTKTGGLVVWRRKDTLVVYRGCNNPNVADCQEKTSSDLVPLDLRKGNTISQVKPDAHEKMMDKDYQPITSSLYERETDRLLDGLGPRFIDWWMHKPLPVDADLLPEVINGFGPPFRRCPPYTRSQLTDDELTYFRKLAHSLPTHFVLGIHVAFCPLT